MTAKSKAETKFTTYSHILKKILDFLQGSSIDLITSTPLPQAVIRESEV